jgi:acyl dehydratase
VSADISYEFAFGSYEEAARMVGTRTEPRFAGTAVSAARIQHFAAMVRDANPAYWDSEFAQKVWGGIVAPPALLIGLLMPPPWVPSGKRPTASIAIRIPLPGTAIINAFHDAEFLAPVVEGDRLSVVEEVVSVSPEKTTRLGVGHFIETLETYYRGDGSRVATSRNTLLRYTPAARA